MTEIERAQSQTKEKPTKFVQKVKQEAENKRDMADQYSQEAQPNIRANANHFLDCLRGIPPEKQAEIKSPDELIEALNEVAKKGNKSLFFGQGETFFLPGKGKVKIIEIHPLGVLGIRGKGFYLNGINTWDNHPSVGSHFAPCIYFFEKITSD